MDKIMVIFLSSLLGGAIQSVTGFGSAIIIMIFLPYIFPMTVAPAVSDVITMILSFAMFWRYRKKVNVKRIFIPVVFYILASTLVIHKAANWDTGWLKIFFGLFLLVLAGYFFLFSEKIKIRATMGRNIGCAILSGICGGMFGISGPPVSAYYLTATDTKEEYLGTINGFFSVVVISNLFTRAINGFITTELVPAMLLGIIGILSGFSVGNKISGKIDSLVMRKCIYTMMIFAGVMAVVQGMQRERFF